MKILCLHDAALDSGKANVIQMLYMCRAFVSLGQDVTLAIPASKGISSNTLLIQASSLFEHTINFKIIPYPKFTICGRLSMLGGYFSIKELLKKIDIDCVWTRNHIYTNISTKLNIPTIFESHNAALHNNNFLNRVFSSNLLHNSHRKELCLFVCISQNLADFWINTGIPRKKVIALHDGVDVKGFQIVPNIKTIRKELTLPADQKIIVYAGSFYPDREIENILELAQNTPKAFFVLIGGPNQNAADFANKAINNKISNISFLGQIPHKQVKNYLFAADILLMVWSEKVPTIQYCSPLKMFEYMAAGKIIVGHGFPTIKEVLTDGKDALLANPLSPKDLKTKMDIALSLPKSNNFGKNARELAFHNYSWDKRAEIILQRLKCQVPT